MSKISRETLERFKQLNPKRFAELQAQAERDWNKPTIRHTISHTPSTTLQPSQQPEWFRRGLTLEQTLEEFRAGRKRFMVHTKDHRYFELANTPEEAVAEAERRHANFFGPVIRVEEMPT